MDDIPLSCLTEDDPQNYLDEPARRRIKAAQWQGETLRQRVFAELELEYKSKKDPQCSFSEYIDYGEGAIRMARARMEHASLVLQASLKEYRAAGISGSELRRIMREELEGAVNSLELSIPQRDLLSLELNAPTVDPNAPDEPKPALTDEIYEQARREAEQRYQIAMVEWLEIAVAEAKKAESPPLDVQGILKETWSKAWKGEKPETNLDTRARVPTELMMKLIEACEGFLKAELRAYLSLLERSGVPASQRLSRLERELNRILFETRTRKWSRAITERLSSTLFRNDDRWLLRSWTIVEDAIRKFVHNDLEFDFWISEQLPSSASAMPKATQPSPVNLERRRQMIDEFLLRCREEAVPPIKRKHLWQAVGHTSPRQFYYWQAGDERSTQQDDQNFRRILSMLPSDFIALLRKKNLL